MQSKSLYATANETNKFHSKVTLWDVEGELQITPRTMLVEVATCFESALAFSLRPSQAEKENLILEGTKMSRRVLNVEERMKDACH